VSDELEALRNDLTTWYMSLDQRTQGFFEAAYTKAPEAVTQALGGQAVGANEVGQYSTLAAMLGADAGGDVTKVVPYMWSEAPRVDPATANVKFGVHWTDRNYGALSSGGHYDELKVFDESNTEVFGHSQYVGPLQNAAEAQVDVDVEPGLQPGKYVVRILHNKDGVMVDAAGYANREHGISSLSEATFDVAATGPGGLDLAMVKAANDEMRSCASAARTNHHDVLADTIDTYAKAFGAEPGAYANEVAAIYRATTQARAADGSDQAFFTGTPSAGALVSAGDAVLAGQGTPRQLMDAMNALARELVAVAGPHTTDDADFEELEESQPVAKAAAPTLPAEPKQPYADLAAETADPGTGSGGGEGGGEEGDGEGGSETYTANPFRPS
jgi:hypothetical protein